MELASLVTTNMAKDQFYRSADQGLARMKELLTQVDPKFAAQTAVYVRNTDGLRSITHAVAAEIAHEVKHEQWTKNFYRAVVRRPDDVTEILSYYLAKYGKPIPNSLKKGLGMALGKFDAYQIAKYRGENHGLKLIDAVNIVHPRPTERNAEPLRALVADTLRSTDTFEAKLSAAGSDAKAKKAAWSDLLEGRIGQMALLKNLRNIAQQSDPALTARACELLTDKERVERSLILPFRFVIAMNELKGYPKILRALSEAVDLSLHSVPDLGDKILIAVDGSGSMTWGSVAGNPDMTPNYLASLFAAALFKKNDADVKVFDTRCKAVSGLNPADSTLTITDQIKRHSHGGGTSFQCIFDGLKSKYDTIVILSDMQAWADTGWYGASHPSQAFANYKRRSKANPKVFAFDLQGYGTIQFPEKDVYQLAGFSDSTVGLMSELRKDERALVNIIKRVEF